MKKEQEKISYLNLSVKIAKLISCKWENLPTCIVDQILFPGILLQI